MEIIKLVNTIPSNPVTITVIILIHGQSTMMIWITPVWNIQLAILNYDEIIHLLNGYISSNNFSKHAKPMTRQSFIKHMEISHPGITTLCPVNKQITLHDNTLVTVPVFDARAMIMDILTNTDMMNQENIADGYNILQGMLIKTTKVIVIMEKYILEMSGFRHETVTVDLTTTLQMTCHLVLSFLEISLIQTYTVL